MTWTDLLHSVSTVTARTRRAPTAATAPQVMWPGQAPHTALPRSSSKGSVWEVTWKWARPQAWRKLSSLGRPVKTSGRRPCSPAPSQPRLLLISPSLGSGCELCHRLHTAMPLLGSNTTKCFNASATGHEALSAICPGLAAGHLPMGGPQAAPQAVQPCKVLQPHTAHTLFQP